jgi:HAD superfamily hydrolase (TIGR01509 family)
MTVAAVIFDLDGVIVDSEIWWHEERAAWAAARGLAWTEADTRALMGANTAGWARIMRERLGLAEADEATIAESIVTRVAERYADGAPIIDGAVGTVHRIAATWPVAIASSAHRQVIDAALDATGLRATISVVVSSDEVAHGKPAPDVYLEAARRLGVATPGCLVIEDSINGLRAGRAAGMRTVLVPNASVPPAPGAEAIADHVLARLSDLDPDALSEPVAESPVTIPGPSASSGR